MGYFDNKIEYILRKILKYNGDKLEEILNRIMQCCENNYFNPRQYNYLSLHVTLK